MAVSPTDGSVPPGQLAFNFEAGPGLESLDPKLVALKEQIGEAAWQDRLCKARDQESVVLQVHRMVKLGFTRTAAVAALEPPQAQSTVKRWILRYAEEGFLGLLDRRGTVASRDVPEGPTEPGCVATRRRKPHSFIRWVGGKFTVMSKLRKRLPSTFKRYYEPMVGSGAVFLDVKPEQAVLADLNAELMNCYVVVRDRVEELLTVLGRHSNSYRHFIEVRSQDPGQLDPVERAARLVFLNKTCFNGLYRVNSKGRFNVPYGDNPRAIFRDEVTLRRVSGVLQGVSLRCGDFADTVADAERGDLVYFDPPYARGTRKAKTFHSYQPEAFGEPEHRRLAEVVRELDRRGCKVVLSNSNSELVRELFEGYTIDVLRTRRPINRNTAERDGWDEVVVHNLDSMGRRRRGRR